MRRTPKGLLKNFGSEDVKSRKEEIADEARSHKCEPRESISINEPISLDCLRINLGSKSLPSGNQFYIDLTKILDNVH
jgi:hypothetical protein